MTALVLPLDRLTSGDLPLVGGKAVNLGELSHAGVDVPDGFCVTTAAFERFVGPASADIGALLAPLVAGDLEGIRRVGTLVRARLRQQPLPAQVVAAVTDAWRRLGPDDAYAVRSSATAEDLPTASFAGQQDTYLNVRGRDHLLGRVRDCFVSLFTDRALLYRLEHGVPHDGVALAVIVQRMVDAEGSGVLFTADPVNGNRSIAAIEASYGLGEALVSGVVTGDAVRVDKRTGRIFDVRVADKHAAIVPRAGGGTEQTEVAGHRRRRPVLDDGQIRALVRLGARIEAHYDHPQDIEWALAGGAFVVTQSRPITTLFPLPEPPPADDSLHGYLSFGHLQVMTDPMPVLVTSMWRRIVPVGRGGQGGASRYVAVAGGRLYVDVTEVLRHPLLGRLVPRIVRFGDPLAAAALADLAHRPAFRARGPRARLRGVARAAAPYAARSLRALLWSAPEGRAQEVQHLVDARAAEVAERITAAPDLAARLDACDRELRDLFAAPSRWLPEVAAGMIASGLLGRLLPDGSDEDRHAVVRGLVGNLVTEMDLAVGDLADVARASEGVVDALARSNRPVAARLAAAAELNGGPAFMAAWHGFLDRYGTRGTSEIDLSRPRWSEDPTPLVQMVLSAARQAEPGAHRAHHRALQDAALAAAGRLDAAARRGRWGFARQRSARRLIRVARGYLALREHHKHLFMRVFALVRGVILQAGEHLWAQGRLTAAVDVWFLSMDELRAVLSRPGGDLTELVAPRREDLQRARGLTPPRVLTSAGEIISAALDGRGAPDGALVGTPVSAGVVEGTAKVVLDPATAHLEPGEILVARFTDPGWTPLFVSAAGLVTEVGGVMTHGSLVAREYGIPAVVGVADATTRICSGQRLRVHGEAGYVELLDGDGSGR